MILLFTITLASTGALNGMQEITERSYWGYLPKKIKQSIIGTALATSNNVDEAINAIKTSGALYGLRYDTPTAKNLLIKSLPNNLDEAIEKVKTLQGATPKDFTKLVHMLADKFNLIPYDVAEKFNTPTAEKYIDLYIRLSGATSLKNLKIMKELISRGADVKARPSIISAAIVYPNEKTPEIIKFLLENGANPSAKSGFHNETPLENLNRLNHRTPEYTPIKTLLEEQIKTLLEEAIAKRQ